MCGILGILEPEARYCADRKLLSEMALAMRTRGPDHEGIWTDANAGVGLAHRRLSIIDLSPEGAQPMVSGSGRYIAVLNGEIYNFPDLRSDLEALGHAFRGRSDTEVALAAIEQYGFVGAIEKFIGMFALAVWDREQRSLYMCRDRIGKKPLYYGDVRGAFVFSSVLGAMRRFPGFDNEVDRDSLALYVRYNYVPAPFSIFKGIRKLEPGNMLRIDVGVGGAHVHAPTAYWSADEIWRDGGLNRYSGTREQCDDDLESLLRDAVSKRMVSDVPLGAFLSGGIDSSVVVALMQQESARPVKTFTVGFLEDGYNEAEFAGSIAKHLGTDHTEVYLRPQDALDVIPRLPELYDEPFSDSSQVPTFLVAQVAREKVTVALSGDGGDELFGGYNRYLWWRQIWRRLRSVPVPARRLAARALLSISVNAWNRMLLPFGSMLPAELQHGVPGLKIHKAAGVLSAGSPDQLYKRLVSTWRDPESIVIGGAEPSMVMAGHAGSNDADAFTERMMLLDILTYLPDDILVKLDRASMGVSLETRNPLLDHRVLEFAATLPLEYKLNGTTGKLPLRRILNRYVPESLFDRPKAGFGMPIDAWLKGPLRGWAEELIAPDRLAAEGYFRVEPIRQAWGIHQRGGEGRQHHLWCILMFQAWLETLGS
jgi:asparagine synthase (glutamine-hydrolysing)